MSVVLASVCCSISDLERLREMHRTLADVYQGMTVILPSDLDGREIRIIQNLPRVRTAFHRDHIRDGYLAVATSLDVPATHIHSCDLGHLLRWAASRPAEWRDVVSAIQGTDCLIIGRSENSSRAGEPAALETERVVNVVFSRLLGHSVDLCSGNRGLSRLAARYVLAHSRPWACEDAAWPILLYRASFTIHHIFCDRLDPDTPSPLRHVTRSGSSTDRASAWDHESQHWVRKVREALDIVQDGLLALQQPLPTGLDESRPRLAQRRIRREAALPASLTPASDRGR